MVSMIIKKSSRVKTDSKLTVDDNFVKEIPLYPNIDEQLTHRAHLKHLKQAIKSLNDTERVILKMWYTENKTEPQIASILGCSVRTVSSKKSAALKYLREKIQK